MAETSIAVLMTCHNRRDTTLACLDALMAQNSVDDVSLHLYIVDDGSTDGTGEAIAARYPDAALLRGDGSLYWCGGMRRAFDAAVEQDHDYHLWLNDDTFLFPEALRTALDCAGMLQEREGHPVILAGSTRDPETGELNYGGRVWKNPWAPLGPAIVTPGDQPLPCDTTNGNFLLIPREIIAAVGNLSPDYTHGIADYDYGLRARECGYTCWIMPGYAGACASHTVTGSIRDADLPIAERLDMMSSRTALMPIGEKMRFIRRHCGFRWPILWAIALAGLAMRTCCPRLWLHCHRKRRHCPPGATHER